MTKTHIMRFAPMDYRTSRVRVRSATTSDPILRAVYLEALFALYENGGSLPADPDYLADELALPAQDIARCLPILDAIARSGSGRGGIFVEGDRIWNGRVREELAGEEAYRAQQAELGRQGARVGGKGRGVRKGKAKPPQTTVRGTPNQPLTIDRGTPNPPAPLPTPNASNGETTSAGSLEGDRADPQAPVENPGGDGPQTSALALSDAERREYADAVWAAFRRKSGDPETRVATAAEWQLLEQWIASVPLFVVLRGIQDTRGRGSRLNYFASSVAEAFQTWRRAVPA